MPLFNVVFEVNTVVEADAIDQIDDNFVEKIITEIANENPDSFTFFSSDEIVEGDELPDGWGSDCIPFSLAGEDKTIAEHLGLDRKTFLK